MKRKVFLFGLLALVVAMLLAGVIGIAILINDFREQFPGPLPFDSEVWKKGYTNDIRLRMCDDLLSKHNLKGLTKDEVLALLGQPGKSAGIFFSEKPGFDMLYQLDDGTGVLCYHFLGLRLDSSNCVTKSEIYRYNL